MSYRIVRLSQREQEILVELATGPDTHAVIAERLGISAHTINAHLHNMYRATGTRNHIQLLRWAFREAKHITAPQRVFVRCDCGRVAAWRGRVPVLSAEGKPQRAAIVLCDACRASFDGEEVEGL